MWIELINANPDHLNTYQIPFTPGMTAKDALILAGLPIQENLSLGIFSEKITLETVLNSDDRLEIYYPITADPKIKRHQNVKPMGKWHRARTGFKKPSE